jgi:hypothetical protein
VAQGWLLPAVTPDKNPTNLEYFADRRAALLEALAAIGRDPEGFALVAQVPTGDSAATRAGCLEAGVEAARLGATHVILGMHARLGAAGVDAVAREVAEPLRAALG